MEFPARVVSCRTRLVHELGPKRILPENDLKPITRVKVQQKAGNKLFHAYLPQRRKQCLFCSRFYLQNPGKLRHSKQPPFHNIDTFILEQRFYEVKFTIRRRSDLE